MLMKKYDFIKAVNQLGLNQDDYIVIGSGILCALEIRDVSDVDLIVSELVFQSLETSNAWRKKYFEDGTYYLLKDMYEIGLGWDSKNAQPNLRDLKRNQLIIDDVPFISLERLIQWKEKKRRDKDIEDIKLIEQYLREHSH